MITAAVLSALLACPSSQSAPESSGVEFTLSIPIGASACFVRFTDDGTQARVAPRVDLSSDSSTLHDVPLIDCATHTVVGQTRSTLLPNSTSRSWVPWRQDFGISGDPESKTVMIKDLLNDETAAVVDVGATPGNISSTPDGTAFIVVCSEPDSLVWINTASFEVVTRLAEGIGPDPVFITNLPGERYALINNQGGNTVSVLDHEARKIVDVVRVEANPVSIAVHPSKQFAYVACEQAQSVCVLILPDLERKVPEPFVKNEVLILGTIHGGHLSSETYDLALLDAFVREVDPDYILAEIPPDRARAAMEGFLQGGEVTEPRVMRFPEYKDVVYPLTRELHFEIVPTAGWTEPMARFRSNRLKAISEDQGRVAEWAEYEAASRAAEECQDAAGSEDDPYFVNSGAYDDCVELDLAVYDRLFNDELGPGGWTAINRAHYGNIARALDEHAGQGKRFLITYGAGHKGWFLRKLQKRTDIELVEVAPFLMQAETALGRR